MDLEKVVEVVAGVIEQNGHILIAQRKAASKHPLKWEFPGGKVETGESPQQALSRELREELGIEAKIAEEIERYDFRYGAATITRLFFFRVTEFAGEPQNLDFEQIRWEKPSLLPDYDFLEGDVRFLERFR
jgi:8-oxo-dGTP diphosphatase